MNRDPSQGGGRLWSVRARIVVVLLLALLPVVLARAWDMADVRSAQLASLRAGALASARIGAERHEAAIARADMLLALLGEIPVLRNAGGAACAAALGRVAAQHPWQSGLLVLAPSGQVACRAGPQDIVGTDLWSRGLVQQALSAHGHGSTVVLSEDGRPPVLVLARSLRDGRGVVQSIAVAVVDLAWISRLETEAAASGQATGRATVMIIDAQGRVLAAGRAATDWIGRSIQGTAFEPVLEEPGEGQFDAGADPGASSLAVGFAPLGRSQERIVVGLSQAAAMAGASSGVLRDLWLLFVVALAGVGVGLAAANALIIRWTDRLRAAATRICAGRSARIALPPAAGEIAAIGRALDESGEALHVARAALQDGDERLRAFMTYVPGALLQLRRHADGSLAVVAMSDSSARLGYRPDELTGDVARLLARVHPDDDAAVKAAIERAVEERSSLALEFRLLDPIDGVLRTRLTAAPRVSTGPEVVWDGLWLDVTEQRSAEQAADLANRARADFLAAISHEVRAPLNGIIVASQRLMEGRLGGPERQQAQAVHDTAQGLLSAVRQILDFSRLDSGPGVIESAPFSIREVAESAMARFEATAAQKGLGLSLDLAADCSALVTGDAACIRQVLESLIGNAVKFTQTGSVRLAAAPVGGSRTRLRFTVTDTGLGIRDEQVPLLFRPFTQLEADTRRSHGGIGLGLAASKRLVEAMGGEIGVYSVHGQGSTFWVELDLPAADADGLDDRSAAGADQVAAVQAATACVRSGAGPSGRSEAQEKAVASSSARAAGMEIPPHLLGPYLADLSARLSKLLTPGLARDELQVEAHRLVATAGQLGLVDLCGRCRELDEACAGSAEADLEPYLQAIREAAGAIASELAELTRAADGHGESRDIAAAE